MAQGLHALQVAAGPLDGAALDIGLALAGERVDVVGLDPQRVGIIADRLAGQALRLGDMAERDIGGAVARIDRERRLEQVVGLVIAPGGALRLGLLDQSGRARVDLVVGALALARARHGRRGDGERENNRRKAHQILHISITPALARPLPARDEKAVGAVPRRTEQEARPGRESGRHRQRLRNQR